MGTKNTTGPKRANKTARPKQPAKGRRFTKEQKEHALTLVVSGMKRTKVAKTIGTTVESLRRWVNEATADGTMAKPPGTASSPSEATLIPCPIT